ncbi:alpha/beta hydrolase [Corynebacterium sp. UMB8791]
MDAIRSLSVVSTGATWAIYLSLAASVVVALWYGRQHRRIALAIAAALLAAAYLLLAVWPKPFPDAIPWHIYASCAAAVFVVATIFLAPRWRWRLAPLAVIPLMLAYLAVNLVYEQYPTLGSFRPVPVTVSMNLDQFREMTTAPILDGREVGALVTLPAAPLRDAIVYVPPAYWHGEHLPVLVLLAGSPGSPIRWFDEGGAQQTLDDYQVAHDGVAPIVVSADGTGTTTGNPGCVDGPDLQIQTYLAQQIPQLVKENFRVKEDQRTWTIGGLSYGGTCALQVITNDPTAYGTFLDYSGEAEPNLGGHQRTVDVLFGGDEAAFQAVNPETLLQEAIGTATYKGIAGRFAAGKRDQEAMAALPRQNELAQKAEMSTTFRSLPGGHSFEVWRVALRQDIDFVAQRGGIQ